MGPYAGVFAGGCFNVHHTGDGNEDAREFCCIGLLTPMAQKRIDLATLRVACFFAWRPLFVVLTFLTFFEPSIAVPQGMPAAAIDELYARFQKTESSVEASPPAARAKALAEFYSTNIADEQKPAALQQLPANSVDLLFRATYDTAFYTYDQRYVQDMQADLDRLRALHADELRHYQDLYTTLVSVRDFDAARAVLASQPKASSDPAPDIVESLVDSGRPSALVLSESGSSATQQPIQLSGAIDIVVIGHPLCHFSHNAVAAIEADPRLNAVFARHAQWLMPQDGRMQPRVVAPWNVAHPLARMDYIYRQRDWPAIDTWSTPTFYFFKNGMLVGKLAGWAPNGDGERALRGELKKLGLL